MLKWILEIFCDDVNRLHVAQGRRWLVGGKGGCSEHGSFCVL